MTSLRQEALAYVPKGKVNCIECGKSLIREALRCRRCYNILFKEVSPFIKGFKGENNGMWKGNQVGYWALHDWIRRNKPQPLFCEICHIAPPKQIANISGIYQRDINDFQWLCVKCHVYKDGTVNNLKLMQQKGVSRNIISLEGGAT